MNIIATFCFVVALPAIIAESGSCPEIYKRFSENHTFCKAPNATCQVIWKGVSQYDINTILDAHNKYRSKLASGKLKRLFLSGSNMLQLTWDEELAGIAQKWAEQCNGQHDCDECRATRSFSAGQNIALFRCGERGASCEKKYPLWSNALHMFFVEKTKTQRSSYLGTIYRYFPPNAQRFKQMFYAETYKVGCGYVFYSDGGDENKIYVCNYGPASNMQDDVLMYKVGPPCSACPKNSCCEELMRFPKNSCGSNSYPSLCKLNGPPEFVPKDPTLYLCTFQPNDPKCQFNAKSGGWTIAPTSGGNFLSIVARVGSTNVVSFNQKVKVKRGSCFILTQRRGPEEAGKADQSTTEVEFEQNGRSLGPTKVYSVLSSDFMDSPVQISADGEIKFSIKFSVPAGAPPQFLEIKRIQITESDCKSG